MSAVNPMNTSYQPRRVPVHEQVVVRDLRHHVTRWAGEEPGPLVLLHGWMDTGDTFQFLVDAMSDRHSFVAADWRGFGRTEWPPDGYWFPDYYADLDALLDLWSPDAPVTLVGHSMGGNIAGLYGGIRPERVARLVNLEGFGLPRAQSDQAPDRYAKWLDQLKAPPQFGTFPSLEQFARVLARKNPRLPPDRALFVARTWATVLPDGRCTVSADPAHKLVNPVLYRREEAEACWRRCVAPTLLVLGGRSEFRPGLGTDGTDDYFRGLYPNLRIETLPEAGHMMHHEEPAAVAALLDAFLAERGDA
jgi:pimeloyl-ACP methyl ester carboxylesterase